MGALDTNYFRQKLALISRDLSHYTPQEMARELVRLAKVADETEAVKEAPSAPVAPQAAEDWLRQRYGAARGHHAWRDLAEAFNAGAALSVKAGSYPEIPEGWQLVPKDPTIEMVAALGWEGDEVLAVGHALISKGIADSYAAMLAAAPTPPTTGEA